MFDLTDYTQIPHELSCVCLFVAHPQFAHPRRETPFHTDTGTQRVCGTNPDLWKVLMNINMYNFKVSL